MKSTAAIFSIAMLSTHADAMCFDEASARYRIPADLLRAVAKTESGLNPRAVNRNPNRTRDVGLMQINDTWLPSLKRFGINEADLYNSCTNVMVGAWILANNAAKYGWNWDAIGAYNVGCARLSKAECERRRAKYARKVHRNLMAVSATANPVTRAPVAAEAMRPAGIEIMNLEGVAHEG